MLVCEVGAEWFAIGFEPFPVRQIRHSAHPGPGLRATLIVISGVFVIQIGSTRLRSGGEGNGIASTLQSFVFVADFANAGLSLSSEFARI